MASPRTETLDVIERWFTDLFLALEAPVFFLQYDIDMTRSQELRDAAKLAGLRLTYGHLLVRAVALALHQLGDLHVMSDGHRRHLLDTVDVAVPVAGTGLRFAPGVMVLRDAGRMPLFELARQMDAAADVSRRSEADGIAALRRAAPLLKRRWLRMQVLRRCLRSVLWRRRYMGTVGVSILKDADFFVSLAPFTGLSVTAGSVKYRPLVAGGQVCARPVMKVACSVDHRIWDGETAERFMALVRDILVGGLLHAEFALKPQATLVAADGAPAPRVEPLAARGPAAD